jgi:hypothetical protein
MKNLMRRIIFITIVLMAIYKVTLYSQTSVTGFNSDSAEKETFKLFQNEPMEFREVTDIKFDLFKSGKVNLNVFDSGGNLIETLIENGEMYPGKYSIYFKSSSELTPGEYFYELNVNGIKKVMKMVFIKT